MRRHGKAGGEPAKGRSHKAVVPKARKKPAASVLTNRRSEQLIRLKFERDEALQQLAATAEILGVIRASQTDVQPVFETIVRNAVNLCGSLFANVFHYDGELLHWGASYNVGPSLVDLLKAKYPMQPDPSQVAGRVVLTKSIVRLEDALADPDYDKRFPRAMRWRRMLGVPILRGSDLFGVIVVGWDAPGPIPRAQEDLLKTFADQALIALENVRLFEAEQHRTAELSEALQRQTATSEVLQVISSSPGELQLVFDTMLAKATALCEASHGAMWLREDDAFRNVAFHGELPPEYVFQRRSGALIRPGPDTPMMRVAQTQQPVHVTDLRESRAYFDREPLVVQAVEVAGVRTLTSVPMFKTGEVIGAITIYRKEVRPFTDKQIELVTNFAAQAVIAIENARLLNELRRRTNDLAESLEQQTATSEVLKVISSSPGELTPVFDSMLANATRICEASLGVMLLCEDDAFRTSAIHGALPTAFMEQWQTGTLVRRNPDLPAHQAAVTRQPVQIADLRMTPAYLSGVPLTVSAADVAGIRTLVIVPMIKDDNAIGVIAIYRQEIRPFTDKQIELVSNFAAQAVIAIENARLLNELRESLRQQTATADVLKVISRSTFDLRSVLQTLVESAARLCDADKAVITRERNGAFYRSESYGFSRDFMDYVKDIPIEAERGSVSGRALLEGRVVHIADVKADREYTFEGQRLGDYRTALGIPMLREGVPIGVLSLTRSEVRPFTEKQLELLTTFADQAAIAIENVRLFESVEARTRELAQSLEDLRTAQDRLVQTEKLASLGQLTAGIAHEIKNPLNFVNNFSGVSVELIEELRQALAIANFDDRLRAEVGEIADMLQGNLDKVVQHGKRADSIVKNMLQHSRQGSGDHRPVDINALVEESLNLAYHGARAEKQGFNITLQRSLDPTAGEVDVFPQDITRVLLNLISNGFYAATKRKAEADGGAHEPTLMAATRNLGGSVIISIRDNGAGIPLSVKEKMFNPFFTTKPAGEGTGLGLSISHDIVVKQHLGSIEVDSQPGEFTEFRIILPRTAASLAKSGGEHELSHSRG